MNQQIADLDMTWNAQKDGLCRMMELERVLIADLARYAESAKTAERKIDAAENFIVLTNTGKELPINGTNAESRKVQTVALLESKRNDPELAPLYAELANWKSSIAAANDNYQSTKDSIEIARLSMAHIDAVLKALAVP